MGSKETELVADLAAGCVTELEVEEERRAQPALTGDEARQVAALAKRAEQHLGVPQDIEWAVDGAPAPDGRPSSCCRAVPRRSGAVARPSGRAVSSRRSACRAWSSTLINPLASRRSDRCRRSPTERFVSPYDDAAPEAAEGWKELYPYYLHFREDRREIEEREVLVRRPRSTGRAVFKPFDTITVEFACRCLGQYNTRHYVIPPANGIDYRVHNGYLYMSPVGRPGGGDPRARARVPRARRPLLRQLAHAAGELGRARSRQMIAELEAITLRAAARPASRWSDITGGTGLDPRLDAHRDYNRAIELGYQAFQYHFEFLNLGYVAYLDFFGFCKEAFPGISDLGIAKMVQGIEVDLFPPDDELKKLARARGRAGRRGTAVARHRRRGARGRRRRATRGRVGRRLGGGQGPVVQLLLRQRHVQRRQGVARPPRDPARVRPRLRRPAAGGPGHRAADGADRRRARPDHGRVPRAAARRRDARGVRREARAVADRVPVRREPQLLHRALVAVAVLAPHPQARPGVRRRGVLGRGRRHLLPAPRRGPAPRCSTTATAGPSAPTAMGQYHWPADHRPAQGDRRGAVGEAAAAGDERAARGHHRAVHDHALRHHDRARRRSGCRARRTATS